MCELIDHLLIQALSPPQTTPERKLESARLRFTLKTHQMFSVQTTREKFQKKRNDHRLFWLCVQLGKTRIGKSNDNRSAIVFEKLRFQNFHRPHENEKLAFSNSSCLKSVFEKLRFRAGLVWTVGLTVEIKVRF